MEQKDSDTKETIQKRAALGDETQLANDPFFSREALRDYTEKVDKVGNYREESSSMWQKPK